MAVVEDAHVVADVLQLAQVVAGHQHGQAALGGVRHEKAPDLPAHHRVEAVHRLVEHHDVRHLAHGQPEGRLLLHALAHAADGLALVKLKDLLQLLVAPRVEARIDPLVVLHHVPDARLREIKDVVGDVGDARLDRRVFVHRLSVHKHLAGVLPENARDVADDRALAGAVRPHEAVDRAGRHRHRQIAQRREAVKALRDVLNFNHRCFLPSLFRRSPRR